MIPNNLHEGCVPIDRRPIHDTIKRMQNLPIRQINHDDRDTIQNDEAMEAMVNHSDDV